MNRYKWHCETIEEGRVYFINHAKCLKLSFNEWLVFYKQDQDKWKYYYTELYCGIISTAWCYVPYYEEDDTCLYYVKFVSKKDYNKFKSFIKNGYNICYLSQDDVQNIQEFAKRYNIQGEI